jgi:serine/threonine protein kinase
MAKFYISQVILGIEYLHLELKIIYRDLKPENVLLAEDGYIKLTDFGLSVEVRVDATGREKKNYTIAGTAEYLAPEIVMNKGHTKDVDWWTVGIFLYELLAGNPPFTDKGRNTERIT